MKKTKKEEYNFIKQLLIKGLAKQYDLGLFFERNILNDPMKTIYKGEYYQIDVCDVWGYIEIFGCNLKEQMALVDIYHKNGANLVELEGLEELIDSLEEL